MWQNPGVCSDSVSATLPGGQASSPPDHTDQADEATPARQVRHRYQDPLDQVWLETARRIGLRVTRTPGAYATTDGRGTLLIGEQAALDPDDCLAQMIFHELCHSLVEGPEAFSRPDWGLDNAGARDDVPREHACLRLQATLAAEHGLRRVFAPTTDFRAFYDALGPDPLMPRGEPSVILAIHGLRRARVSPWAPHLEDALRATATIARQAAAFAPAGPAARETAPALPALWQLVDPEPPRHAAGFPMAPAADPGHASGAAPPTCGTCAWHYRGGPGRAVDRCRQAEGVRISPDASACNRWEPQLDCQECGACCREAYDSVTVSRRDPVRKHHPELIVDRGTYIELARTGGHCAALVREPAPGSVPAATAATPARYSCRIYDHRPRPCHELERSGPHCLVARRRVGLSR